MRSRIRTSPAAALAAAVAAALGATLLVAPPAQAATCPAPGGRPAGEAAAPAAADVAVQGHGYGHSLGMSQYGAQGAARLGCSYDTILRTYYPGLVPQQRALHGRVLIDMLTNGSGHATIHAEGGQVTWSTTSGSPVTVVQPRGSTWSVWRDGAGLKVRAGALVSSPSVPGLDRVSTGQGLRVDHPLTTVRVRTFTPTGSVHLDRRAGYDYTSLVGTAAGLTVREVMEDNGAGSAVLKYLRGIAEMPVSWDLEAHKAQMVAARTYLAGRFSTAEQGYLILPTPAHQNWLGTTQEEQDAAYGSRQREAVRQTTNGSNGVVLVTGAGTLARDVLYTSSHGGWSETNAYVYGSAPLPHLRQVDDSRWDEASGNPYRSWATGASFAQLAQAFGFSSVTDVSVAPQGSASRTSVRVTGVAGGVATTKAFTGWDARQRLQKVLGPVVRSPGFTFQRQAIGGPGAVPLVADVDGDRRADIGWYRAGQWAFRTARGAVVRASFGGRAGDVPVTGDWDGDGRDGIGIFRAGQWHVRNAVSAGPADRAFGYGRAGDVPLVAAWNGGSRDGIAVVRGNVWHLRDTPTGGVATSSFSFGRPTDVPVVGSWLADGVARPGVVRGTRWFLATSRKRPVTVWTFTMGRPGDLPLVGDWDGDLDETAGLARGTTFFLRSGHTDAVTVSSTVFGG